jgi:hypothetical protein
VYNSTGTSIDLTAFARQSPDDLLDDLDMRLTALRLSGSARAIIHDAIAGNATSNATSRAKMAIYLMGVSPQFQVQR